MTRAKGRNLWNLLGHRRATTAIELAFVFFPFIYVLLVIVQMGIFYMTQAALDAGVNTTAANLRSIFTNATTTPTLPSASQLKADVASAAGGMLGTGSGLAVEIRQLSSLSNGPVAVTDGTIDYGYPLANDTPGTPLALRATSSVIIIAPGFYPTTTVESFAIVRRQAQ